MLSPNKYQNKEWIFVDSLGKFQDGKNKKTTANNSRKEQRKPTNNMSIQNQTNKWVEASELNSESMWKIWQGWQKKFQESEK